MTAPSDALTQLIAAELATPVPAGALQMVERIRTQHGDAVRAVVFYGSCLRTADDQHSLLDFYVLVDSYWRLGTRRLYAWLNALLPPNVYYLESSEAGRMVRAKYAVVSLADFARYTSPSAFQAYFWGRFAQPCALVYAADEDARAAATAAVANAVTAFVQCGLGLVPAPCSVQTLWTAQLAQSYRAEVRAERTAVVDQLYGAAAERYERVTRAALARMPFPVTVSVADGVTSITARTPGGGPGLWAMRRAYGKLLSLLRILKSGLTQEHSVEYAMWKVERHSGVRTDPEWQRRHPLLALGEQVWRMYRKGAFR